MTQPAPETLEREKDKCDCGRPVAECIKGDLDYCDALTDPPFICPVTGNVCMTKHDQHCEDYGCARKAGIAVDEDGWS